MMGANSISATPCSRLDILVVEDSETASSFIKQELKGIGLSKIVFAKDGQEGLDKAIQFLDMGKGFDLIIADINMPRMNGLQMIEKLKQKKELSEVPILIVSAERDMDMVIQAINLGVSQYIIKPYSRKDLRDKIVSSFKQKGTIVDLKMGN